jgi:hypothetical protein
MVRQPEYYVRLRNAMFWLRVERRHSERQMPCVQQNGASFKDQQRLFTCPKSQIFPNRAI